MGLVVAAGLAAMPANAADLVLDHRAGFVVPVEVNGHTLRLRVDPGANGVIVLNPAAAERIGLRDAPIGRALARALSREPRRGQPPIGDIEEIPGGPAEATRVRTDEEEATPFVQLGPLLARGRFGRAQARIGGQTSAKVFAWFTQPAVSDVDGLISPAELPYDSVTFRWTEAWPTDRTFTFAGQFIPLAGFTMPVRVGEHQVNVKFSVVEPSSVATAAAGSAIARAYRGGWAGDVRRHHIALDVLRPVRPLALGRAFPVAGMRVSRFLVRHRDHLGGMDLPSDISADSDEIVVTARGVNQPVRFLLVLGQDQFAGCSSLTYHRRAVRLVARCPAG
ncbi:MAG TPA: hypothetical protein VEZ20_00260 [Allosphingosinicella sp.]|nr:hypothetical protein [Allosphingosinicella sp.]